MQLELILSDHRQIKPIKNALESELLLVNPIYVEGNNKIIRTTISDVNTINSKFPGIPFRGYESANEEHKKDIIGFSHRFFSRFESIDDASMKQLLSHIPTKYTLYPPIALFNNSVKRSFINEGFIELVKKFNIDMNDYYLSLLHDFIPTKNIQILAINKPILEADTMRQPHNLIVLFRDDGKEMDDKDVWCELKQNEIWQVWNPMYTMFSRGNIKEKKRILDTFQDVEGNDVVDLYCGIGYFSFSYMKLGCRNLFGFELNHWSTEGFQKGFKLNHEFGYNEREGGCHLYNDNNELSVQRLLEFRESSQHNGGLLRIRHINLGLLPSSKQGWPISLGLLSIHHDWNTCPRVTLHIHENVDIESLNDGSFITKTKQELAQISQIQPATATYHFDSKHLEKIKTFAPDVWHICLDIDITNT